MVEKCFKLSIRIKKRERTYYRDGRIILRDDMLQGYLCTGNYIKENKNAVKARSEIQIYEYKEEEGYNIYLDTTIREIGKFKGENEKGEAVLVALEEVITSNKECERIKWITTDLERKYNI